MKRFAFIAALLAAAPSFAEQHYTSGPKFGPFGSYTYYTGTRTAADVQDYIDDAKEAIRAVRAKHPSGVVYTPRRGLVVLVGGDRLSPYELHQVLNIFEERNLYVSHVLQLAVAHRALGGAVVGGVTTNRFSGKGKVRFHALKSVSAQSFEKISSEQFEN